MSSIQATNNSMYIYTAMLLHIQTHIIHNAALNVVTSSISGCLIIVYSYSYIYWESLLHTLLMHPVHAMSLHTVVYSYSWQATQRQQYSYCTYVGLRENISPMPNTQCHCLHAQLAPWLHSNTVPQQEEIRRLYVYCSCLTECKKHILILCHLFCDIICQLLSDNVTQLIFTDRNQHLSPLR